MHGRYAYAVKLLPLTNDIFNINNVSLAFLLTCTAKLLLKK